MLYSNKFQQLRKRCEDLFMTNESKQYCWRRNEKISLRNGGLFFYGSGEGRAGVCKIAPADPARNAYFRPAKAAPARSTQNPLKEVSK